VSSFTVPTVGSTATVNVADASWIVVGQLLYFDTAGGGPGLAGALVVQAKAGNQLTVLNPTPPAPPPGDMLKSVYDTDGDGVVDAAESVAWANITGKPADGVTTSTTASFTCPAFYASVSGVLIVAAPWLQVGDKVYVIGAGKFWSAARLATRRLHY
jgi:hypothetical protein